MKQTHISPETLQELTSQLHTKKEQLESQLSSFAKKDPNLKGDWDTEYPRVPQGNLEEAADEVEEYSTKLHVEFALETQLKNVDMALERMQSGDYGICTQCETPIPLDRLKVSPEAAMCGKCTA